MKRTLVAIAVLCACNAQGQSINKCIQADGKIAYQDAPCDAKARTAATIKRDRTEADPAALQRAQAERERAEGYSAAREREFQAEQDRNAKAQEAEAKAQAEADRDDRLARAIAAQQPAAVPMAPPVVIKDQTIINNRIVVAPPPTPKPPAPVTFSGPSPPAKK